MILTLQIYSVTVLPIKIASEGVISLRLNPNTDKASDPDDIIFILHS